MKLLSCCLSLLLSLCIASSSMAADALMEDFSRLDAFMAKTPLNIQPSMPRFKKGYEQQQGKLDATAKALITHLKKNQPYAFRSLAGEGMVDVVQLFDDGRTAYVFIIPKITDNFIKNIAGNNTKFYYDLPAVLEALESFVTTRKDMSNTVCVDKGSGYFMFVVQKK